MREHLVSVLPVVADTGNAKGNQLPHVLTIYLRDRNVEFVSDPGDDGFDHLTFALEGLVFRQTKSDSTNTDKHLDIMAAGSLAAARCSEFNYVRFVLAKQSLQYTGLSCLGWNGTCVSEPHVAHTAGYI